jgi:acetyl esterase
MDESKFLAWLQGNKALAAGARIPLLARSQRRLAINVVDNFFVQLAGLSRLQPLAQAHRHNVELIKDVPYLNSGSRQHQLDIYRPSGKPGPWPIALYVHGGGFRILSKETHWLMALAFARQGYLVFNINYRLAPQDPFPAAIQDVCAAYRWVVRNGAAFGGDLRQLVLAGESAGANLVSSLAVATSYARSEPWARQVFDTEVQPLAVVPACGMLQVTDTDRFRRNGRVSRWIRDYIDVVSDCYLPPHLDSDLSRDLADPLLVFERGIEPDRPLPPFFVPVGTADPLVDDTRRLEASLRRLGVDVEARYYEGEPHVFLAYIWKRAARLCWRHVFDFLAHRRERVVAARNRAAVPVATTLRLSPSTG